MGVRGLWEIVGATATRTSLNTLVARGGRWRRETNRTYVLGVDASIWFRQCEAPFLYGQCQAGENPELLMLFHRLAHLSTQAVAVVFVFDGPSRPGGKKGTPASHTDHWLTPGFKGFIEAFGYEWHSAPGEAEAELAQMNRLGIIDAVFTEDSDALVFGADVVIRKDRTSRDDVTVFTHAALIERPEVCLSRGGLLLIALLSGGDYDAGLQGCGHATAHRLALYGLGDSLYAAAMALDEDALSTFLNSWRLVLQDCLRNDPLGHIGRQHQALADGIPDSFPAICAIKMYVFPVISCYDKLPATIHLRNIDTAALARWSELYFTWGTSEGIPIKFRNAVWPAVLVRLLVLKGGHRNTPQHAFFSSVEWKGSRVAAGIEQRKARCEPSPLAHLALSALLGTRARPISAPHGPQTTDSAPMTIWVPAHIVPEKRKHRALNVDDAHQRVRSAPPDMPRIRIGSSEHFAKEQPAAASAPLITTSCFEGSNPKTPFDCDIDLTIPSPIRVSSPGIMIDLTCSDASPCATRDFIDLTKDC